MSRVGVRRLRLLEGAAAANGQVVIIDVFRAATTVAYAIAGGAERVVLVDTADAARELRAARFPNALLAGEIDGRAIDGFDLDNSPAQIERAALAGRMLILRSSSGTQGVLAARRAERVFLGAFVTAAATAAALRAHARVVSLVAIGDGGRVPAEEDEACAAYLESLLRGGPLSAQALIADVRRRMKRAHPAPTWPEDVDRALAIDRFDFAVEVHHEDGLAVARQRQVEGPDTRA